MRINQQTGAATVIGPVGFDKLSGLSCRADGSLIGSTGNAGGQILSIDPATGQATLVGGSGQTAVPAVAVARDDVVYASFTSASSTCGADSLGIVGSNGSITNVGMYGTNIRGMDALAFDSIGRLWGVTGLCDSASGGYGLYRINTATGQATLVGRIRNGPSGFPSSIIVGISFNAVGELYASTGGNVGDILFIDHLTGEFGVVGNAGTGGSISDLTFCPLVFDCCGVSPGTGCNQDTCQECVCDRDPFCCNNEWDQACANQALAQCQAFCSCSRSCCGFGFQEVPGCNDGVCQGCVCAIDNFCCTDEWDGRCAQEAANECAASCPTCPCGAGLLTENKDCDDGNTANGDCCSSTCRFEANGAPCTDGETCTSDQCDGAGSCDSEITSGPLDCSTLSNTVPVNANLNSDVGADTRIAQAADGAGNWMSVWNSTDTLGDTIGNDSDILFAVGSDFFSALDLPMPVNTNAATDNTADIRPKVATDGAGTWMVVWTSRSSLGGTIGNDFDILFSRTTDLGEHWTDPAPVATSASTDTGADTVPNVLYTNGTWVVAWTSSDSLGGSIGGDFDILVARSTDDGAIWSPVAPLNTSAASDAGAADTLVDLAADGATIVAVWQSKNPFGNTGTDNDIFASTSTNTGATWSLPVPVNSNAASAASKNQFAKIATDRAGNWLAVWASNAVFPGLNGNDFDVFVSQSTDDGATWGSAHAVNSTAAGTPSLDSFPDIVTDELGTWAVAWHSNNTLGGTVGPDTEIQYALSYDNGAGWTPAAVLSSASATDTATDQFVSLVSDVHGRIRGAWQQKPQTSDLDLLLVQILCDCADDMRQAGDPDGPPLASLLR